MNQKRSRISITLRGRLRLTKRLARSNQLVSIQSNVLTSVFVGVRL
jgi:hypothetical protein